MWQEASDRPKSPVQGRILRFFPCYAQKQANRTDVDPRGDGAPHDAQPGREDHHVRAALLRISPPGTPKIRRCAAETLKRRHVRGILGGEGGIRTHGTVTRTPHFECGAFDHSATSPRSVVGQAQGQSRSRKGAVSAWIVPCQAERCETIHSAACFAPAANLYCHP